MEADRPTIGITVGTSPGWHSREKYYRPYAVSIRQAGGLPVPLGFRRGTRVEDCHAILVSGGLDVHPRHYARRPGDESLSFDDLKLRYSLNWDEARDSHELPIIKRAFESEVPVLAICRGLQALNVVMGGTLVPDLTACVGRAVQHAAPNGRVFHLVQAEPDSIVGSLLDGPVLRVNSSHHQGVLARDVAPGLRPAAFAPDGVVEALEGAGRAWIVAVQWHPEIWRGGIRGLFAPLFREFVRQAQQSRTWEVL